MEFDTDQEEQGEGIIGVGEGVQYGVVSAEDIY